MQKKQARFTRQETAWMLYDWANSAYSILVAAVLPLFASAMAENAGISAVAHTANWGYASSLTGLWWPCLRPYLAPSRITVRSACACLQPSLQSACSLPA